MKLQMKLIVIISALLGLIVMYNDARAASSTPVTSTVNVSAGGGGTTPTTYYINTAANGGSDSNDGLAATGSGHGPWYSPKHTINCGDTIWVQPGLYSGDHFGTGQQSAPFPFNIPANCSSDPTTSTSNHWAFLKCQGTYIGDCKIDGQLAPSGGQAMGESGNHWWIEGFEVTSNNTTGGWGNCFEYNPYQTPTVPAGAWMAFVNNYVHDCTFAGFTGTGGQYSFMIGMFVFHTSYQYASGSGGGCPSNIAQGVNSYFADTNTTTPSFYAAGIFSMRSGPNINTTCVDGHGWIWEVNGFGPSGTPGGCCTSSAFKGIVVLEQGLFLDNAASGVHHMGGTGQTIENFLTVVGNGLDTNDSHSNSFPFPELEAESFYPNSTTKGDNTFLNAKNNIWEALTATMSGAWVCTSGCNRYAIGVSYVSFTINNSAYVGISGQNCYDYGYNQTCAAHGYSFGTGNVNVSSAFANTAAVPAATAAPNCSSGLNAWNSSTGALSAHTVYDCVNAAGIIAGFTPTNTTVLHGASDGGTMGYRPPGPCGPNANFPVWIPVALIRTGMISMPCS